MRDRLTLKSTHQLDQAADRQDFNHQAPGQRQAGVGKIRQVVERCHNFFAQFGRIGRRLDRSAKRFLGWIELAAGVIFLRSSFVRESSAHAIPG